MATYTQGCSNNSNYSLRLELSESNISISNNTSVVNYSLYLDSTYARFEDWNVSYTLYIGNEVSINKTEKLSMPPTRREPLLLVSGSKTVTHNDDGSRSLSVSCSISTSTSQSYLPGSASISTTFILTTIARKSTMYDVSGTIGKSISLRITKRNSGFTHTIRYSFGNVSGTIVNKGSSNSINWTPPIALYLQIIGSSGGRGTISIETFNGSDSLGSNSYVLTLNAEKTYNVPSVTNFTYERGSGSSDSNWRSDPNGSDVRIKYTASITSDISGNTTSLVVKLGTTILFSSSNASSGSYSLYKQGIGTITTYTATITVSDTIGSSKSWNLTVATIEVPLDINVNLPGIACAKVAETKKAFELAEGWTFKIKGKSLLDFFYPVKSVYITFDNTFDPNKHFGGTWERIRNRFLWAATENGVMGATGGEESHTLTVNEMPSHKGHLSAGIAGTAPYEKGNYKGYLDSSTMTAHGDIGRGWNVYSGNEMHPASEAVGGGQPHNNMPPYLAVYTWKRTA